MGNAQLLAKAGAAEVPKIVKITTKQTMVQNAEGVSHNKEEKTEDLTPGGTGAITVVSSINKAELPEDAITSNVPHVKATQVTTRTALTKEDKETNSTTSSSYPCVPTESRTVGGDVDVMGPPIVTTLMNEGELITTHSITSKTRTVETVTYQKEHDGLVETRVEQKITVQSDGDPIDHDKALAEAIQEATAMNPDMTVEKIEIQQQAVQP